MDPAASQQELLRILDRLLAKGGAKYVEYVEAGLPPVARSCYQPWNRLSLLASGRLPMVCTQNQQAVTVVERPGCAAFYPPYGWNTHRFPATYSQFGIVFREHFTRFIWSGHAHRPKQSTGPDVWYHTSRALPPPARQVLESLSEVVQTGGDKETARLLFNALLRLGREELAADEGVRADKARQTFEHVRAYVQENIHLAIDRDTIARAMRIHPNYLSRLFREQAGETLVHYLQSLRLARALELLRDPGLTVGEVGARAGFRDPGHFFKVFRKAHGVSPGVFRRRLAESASAPAP